MPQNFVFSSKNYIKFFPLVEATFLFNDEG